MIKPFKTALIILLFIFLLSPSILFAGEELYDAPGFDPHRETLSISDIEHIDPFTGGLSLNFVDMKIPGKGGLDLVVQRSFSSKNMCKNLGLSGSLVTCFERGEDSWVGLGWSLHFGRLWIPFTASRDHKIIMPDSSVHEAYADHAEQGSATTRYITRDNWILELDDTNGHSVTLTDGTKIIFGHFAGYVKEGAFDKYYEYYATKIVDTSGNEIKIDYHEDQREFGLMLLDYHGAIKSITDANGNDTSFELTNSRIDGRKRLYSIKRPDGKYITFSYDSSPVDERALLKSVSPPMGPSWEFSYDVYLSSLNHDLVEMTTPHGGSVEYEYQDYRVTVGTCPNVYRTVQSKTVGRTSSEIPTGTWTFNYFQGNDDDETHVSFSGVDSFYDSIIYKFYGYNSGLIRNDMWMNGLQRS